MGLAVKPVGEPDTGNRYVRFDERGWETGRWPLAPSYRAHPRLYREAIERGHSVSTAFREDDVERLADFFAGLPA